MQNIVNYLSPFFGTDGKPVANGRVHFCRMNTSAVKWDDIGDPDYIVIKDRDGVQLPNPLPLNDMGVFEHQPFVDEQLDFKMYVDSPTGISSTVVDAEISDIEKWRTVLVMASRSQKVSVELSGISYVNSVAELREADTSAGCAVVLGYNEAGDFCPARVFFWSKTPYSENYGTHIKSLVDNAGTWVCEPSDVLDLRWFGVDADSGSTVDYTDIISSAANSYPNKPVYFSKGNYYISHNVSMASAVMDPGCFIRPYGSAIVQMAIEHLDDRGAKFLSNGDFLNSPKVIPVIGGVFRSSIIAGFLFTFVFDSDYNLTNLFRDCHTIILDSFEDNDPRHADKGQALVGKTVVVPGGNSPAWLRIITKQCLLVDGNIVRTEKGELNELNVNNRVHVGDLSISKYGETTRISKGGNIVAVISDNGIQAAVPFNAHKATIKNLLIDTIGTNENLNLFDNEDYELGAVVLVQNLKSVGIKVYVYDRSLTEGKMGYVNVGAGMIYMFYHNAEGMWTPVGNYIINQESV